MRKIFLDTGGILALVNKRDTLHKKAVQVNGTLELEEVRFIITDYIVVEIGNALAKHKELAIKTLNHLQTSEDIQRTKITDEIFDQALELYKKYSDKDWGLTDISSFVIMQRENISEAFTADYHFKQFGFRILL